MPATNEQLADYGLAIARFGNLDVNLDDDDNARLKKLAGDTAYSRLAGGFLQAAQAEALQGAGEGMAQGGAAVTPMFLGAGIGMASQMMQRAGAGPAHTAARHRFRRRRPGLRAAPPARRRRPPRRPRPRRPRPVPRRRWSARNCHSQVRAGAKFCGECGTPMAQALHQLQCRPERHREVLRGVRHPGQPAAGVTGAGPHARLGREPGAAGHGAGLPAHPCCRRWRRTA